MSPEYRFLLGVNVLSGRCPQLRWIRNKVPVEQVPVVYVPITICRDLGKSVGGKEGQMLSLDS